MIDHFPRSHFLWPHPLAHGVRKVKNNNKDNPLAPQRGARFVARGKPEGRNPGSSGQHIFSPSLGKGARGMGQMTKNDFAYTVSHGSPKKHSPLATRT